MVRHVVKFFHRYTSLA
ncbi:phage integrase domain protein, partial [Yersinia pestis PY-98]